VNINPGGIAGGSGAQYFVGDFDGTTFRADPDSLAGAYTPPGGEVYSGFDGADYGAWSATGTAFGAGPATGALPGQSAVTGFTGTGLVNTFNGGDAGTGSLTSPSFTISRPYVNLLVGGGAHPHQADTVDEPPPAGTVFADFEGTTYGPGWTATGTFAGTRPAAGTIGDQQVVSGYEGTQLANTFIDHDNGTGTIVSPDFAITQPYINLLVGGGNHPYPGAPDNLPTAVNLVIGGQVVATVSGQDSESLNWANWNVSAYQGQTAHIEIVDQNTGGWGHILVDQVTFADQPAFPRSTETAVNLLVNGEVVRSATGRNSENLDWTNWNVSDLIGQSARIQILDNSTAGFGHLLADQITFADAPARSVEDRSNWLDYGKDYYAAVSFNNFPHAKRVMIGWMNNWNYAGSVPTSPWRSVMSVPREVQLRTVDGRSQLVQRPYPAINALRGSSYQVRRRSIPSGSTLLTGKGSTGKTLDILADLKAGSGRAFGITVRAGSGEETVIGYDTVTRELYVDRTRSGDVGFNRDFPGVQRAPLAARHGRVRFRVLVDSSSVEVFTSDGRRVITDQIFPKDSSRGIAVFSTGGTARVNSLKIWQMRSIW
jgi:levanase